MKTYKTRTNAAAAADKVVAAYEQAAFASYGREVKNQRVSYVITAEADGRFAPLFFAEDDQTAINIAMADHGRSMKGWVPRRFQVGDVKAD
jgi:hypothetical protein